MTVKETLMGILLFGHLPKGKSNRPQDAAEAVAEYLIDQDVVPVVRCKDCKFMEWDCQEEDAIVCRRTNDGYWRGSDDYCSFGRRKEDG